MVTISVEESVEHLQRFNKRDADKILKAMEHLVRAGCIDGYDKLFRKRFAERALKSAGGLVDVDGLAQDVLKEMGHEDPVKRLD